jgi:hypothetical protein
MGLHPHLARERGGLPHRLAVVICGQPTPKGPVCAGGWARSIAVTPPPPPPPVSPCLPVSHRDCCRSRSTMSGPRLGFVVVRREVCSGDVVISEKSSTESRHFSRLCFRSFWGSCIKSLRLKNVLNTLLGAQQQNPTTVHSSTGSITPDHNPLSTALCLPSPLTYLVVGTCTIAAPSPPSDQPLPFALSNTLPLRCFYFAFGEPTCTIAGAVGRPWDRHAALP